MYAAMSLRLLVIRHGIAEDKSANQSPEEDRRRKLTDEGAKKMRRAAQGLSELVKRVDVLASSPLDRAVQTAEIVSGVFGNRVWIAAPLAPRGGPAGVLEWVRKRPEVAKAAGSRRVVAAVVGHEPDLGVLVGWLLSGLEDSFIDLKKAGACLIEFDGELAPGRGKLLWLLRAGELRSLRRKQKT